MFKLIKRLFCDHNYVFSMNIPAQAMAKHSHMSYWKCSKCGKVQVRNYWKRND